MSKEGIIGLDLGCSVSVDAVQQTRLVVVLEYCRAGLFAPRQLGRAVAKTELGLKVARALAQIEPSLRFLIPYLLAKEPLACEGETLGGARQVLTPKVGDFVGGDDNGLTLQQGNQRLRDRTKPDFRSVEL